MDFTEKNSHVATDTITCIILGITLYVMNDSDWACETIDAGAVFLDPYLEIQTYIDWVEEIVEIQFSSKAQKRDMCTQLCLFQNV